MKHDANSILREQGPDALRAVMDRAVPFKSEIEPEEKANGHAEPPNTNPFKLIHIDDLVFSDDPVWLVDGLIPAGPSLGLIFGKQKSGKTFGIADLFYHVAMGRQYCDLPVKQGVVVYVTSEGVPGFHRRMIAMRAKYGVSGAPFYVINAMPNLGEKTGDAELLIQAIKDVVPPNTDVAAVIVDTLRRATPGKNESSSEDMGIFVSNCDAIKNDLKCFVAAVHHSPRSDDGRSSGSNVLDAAVDIIISVIKDAATKISTMTIEEIRDGESGLSWRFHVTNFDAKDRNQKDGCGGVCATISKPAMPDAPATKAQPKMSPQLKRLYMIVCDCITEHGAFAPGSSFVPSEIRAVTREQVGKYAETKGFSKATTLNSFRAVLSKYLDQLAGKELIGLDKEHAWLPKR